MTFRLMGKIVWKVTIETKTGLHIGASGSIYELGAPDLPVIKTGPEGVPYIPGSSLKGKLRSLLERHYLDLTDLNDAQNEILSFLKEMDKELEKKRNELIEKKGIKPNEVYKDKEYKELEDKLKEKLNKLFFHK